MLRHMLYATIIPFLSLTLFTASAEEWETFYPVRGFEDVAFRNGELWCGTGSGLFILDPEDFSYRRVTSMDGYPGTFIDEITQLVWENDKSLLVATGQTEDVQMGKGIYRHYPATGEWSQINSSGTIPPFVTSMTVDSEGVAWLCNDSNLYFVRNDSLIIVTEEIGLPPSVFRVRCVTADQNGKIWIGYNKGEIGSVITAIAKREDEGIWETVLEYPVASIENMIVADNNSVWFSVHKADSIFTYDRNTLSAVEFDNVNIRTRLAVTKDCEGWFINYNQLFRIREGRKEDMTDGFLQGIENAGGPYPFSSFKNVYVDGNIVWVVADCGISASTYSLHYDVIGRYINSEWSFFIPEDTLIYPYCRFSPSILGIGGDGAVWMSGYTFFSVLPVLSFDDELWKVHDIDPFYSADHIFADHRNRTWIIGRSHMYQENGNLIGYLEEGEIFIFGQEEYPQFADAIIHGTATASAVWTTDASGNVYRYEYDGEWVRFDASDTGVPGVRNIAADKNGLIWVMGDHAIGWFDGSEWNVDTGFPSNLAYDIAVDEQGVAWFATYTGLHSFDNGIWNTFTVENSGLPRNDLSCLVSGQNGDLWIGTRGGGLCRYDGESWKVFTNQNARLPSNYIRDIAESPDGSIWIAANGLVHYTPDDLPTLAETESKPRPAAIAINGAWPNPFNSMVTVEYELAETMPVVFEIYSITGQRVYRRDLGRMTAGLHRTIWDGIADDGGRTGAGIYMFRLDAGKSIATGKALYLK